MFIEENCLNAYKWKLLIKRFFDLMISLIIFFISIPVFIIIAFFIKINSKGPVLYKQKRLGKNKKVFNCIKFRTMVIDADEKLDVYLKNNEALRQEWNANYKLKCDPRVTGVGLFLRKTSLDELPQIINVIRGEMSLIGPRPRPLYELNALKKHEEDIFNTGLLTRPGITGLWQVSGRNDLDFSRRMEMDADYVLSWSIHMDLIIILKTIGVVVSRKGAF